MQGMKLWLMALTSAFLLVACGNGSVRSPDRFGAGALLSIELRCETPSGAPCGQPNAVAVGAFVNYRVIGTFENGSTADITAQDRIVFPEDAFLDRGGSATLIADGPNKGRVSGNRATEAGAPVVIVARDREGQAEAASAQLRVFGAVPTQVNIFSNAACTIPAEGTEVASGTPQQFFARVAFDNPNVAPLCTSQDSRLQWSVSPTEGASISQTGVFIGENPDPATNAMFDVTATFRPEPGNPDAPDFSPISDTVPVEVLPAEFVPGSLRLLPPAATIPVGGTVTFTAFGTFTVGQGETVEIEITDALSALTSGSPAFADFQDSEDPVPNVLEGLQPTPDNAPVTVTASFEGDSDTATVIVLEPRFGFIELVPVGVAPYEEAGLFDFPELSEEAIQELKDTVARNALLLGTDENGQVPTCVDDGTPCPNGALDRHQTLPSVSLAYAVVGFLQDDADRERGVLLRDFAVQCDDDRTLEIALDGADEVIGLRTMVPVDGTASDDPDAPVEMVPATTASGTRIVLVDGLTEGVGTVRARLGAAFGSGESGFNCRSTVDNPEPVEDAEQDVRVGFVDDTGNPVAISRSAFNIDKNFSCVGFTNASNLAEADEIQGRDKLLTALIFETEDEQRFVINANQQSNVSFRALGGPANANGQGCRNDPDPEAEEPAEPRPANLDVENGFNAERGVITAQGATGLDNNCVTADFEPAVPPPNFDGTTPRSSTWVILPVDDDILRGDSAISGEQVDGLCGALGPLLTLPVGPLFGLEQGSGLPNELIALLGGLLGPILNNEQIEGPVTEGLEGLLNQLSEGLGLVLETTMLDQILGPLTDLLGLTDGGQEPVEGATLLPTLTDGLNQVLQAINDQLVANSPSEEPPATENPGDPFRDGSAEGGEETMP